LASVRRQLADLSVMARYGQPRGKAGIESAALRLAQRVLPDELPAELIEPGTWLSFDSLLDLAADIPWEVIPICHWRCTNDRCPGGPPYRLLPIEVPADPRHCPFCGEPSDVVRGPLVLAHVLSHEVRGFLGRQVAWRGSDRFLVIIDPTQEITGSANHPAIDADLAAGIDRHVARVSSILHDAGLQVTALRGLQATRRAVAAVLADPRICGMYYIGPGGMPRSGAGGALRLADGERWSTSDWHGRTSGVPFVFLNLCEGTSPDGEWDVDRKLSGPGHAAARGGRTVVSTLWPIAALDAARFAEDFFSQAVGGMPVGEALRMAREASHERYVLGAADLGWCLYRIYGPPDVRLSPPRPATADRSPAGSSVPFDGDGRLIENAFSFFPIPVLTRADHRRLEQGRPSIDVPDLVFGLIEHGALLGFLLRQANLRPREVKDRLLAYSAPEPPAVPGDEDHAELSPAWSADSTGRVDQTVCIGRTTRIRSGVQPWSVDDFAPEAAGALTDAGESSAGSAGSGAAGPAITELALLTSLVQSPGWPSGPNSPLPRAEHMLSLLADTRREEWVDANGFLCLEGLDEAAARAVETAHDLAQQRGMRPVPDRLLLAAFLANPEGQAAELCRREGRANPEALARLLVSATRYQGAAAYPLCIESSEGVIVATLREARRTSGKVGPIEEGQLFQAFCKIAAPDLKEALRALPPPWSVDLDELVDAHASSFTTADSSAPTERLPPAGLAEAVVADAPAPSAETRAARPETGDLKDSFDPQAWAVVARAAHWARIQGARTVHTPHLFASLLGDEAGPLPSRVRDLGLEPEDLKVQVLRLLVPEAPSGPPSRVVTLSRNSTRILRRAIDEAEMNGRRRACLSDLVRAFQSAGSGVVGKFLRLKGIELWTEEEDDE
jgi:hypothetical protein